MPAGGNGKGKGKPPVPPGKNDAPVAVGDLASVNEDVLISASGNVLANDTDPNAGDTKSVITVGTFVGAFGTLVLNADGSYTYTLNNGNAAVQSLAQGQSGTDVFAYTMSDAAGATSSSLLTVTINGTNDTASISGTATGAVMEDGPDQTVSGALAVSDVDSGEDHFQTPASLAGTYGNFTFNAATGAWSYTLNNGAANVQALTGTDAVQDTLTVTSFDGTASQTITVTINGADDGPPPRIERVSESHGTEGDGPSYTGFGPLISFSADGRYSAFYSEASNLVPGDTNGQGDFFILDRDTNTLERVPANNQYPGGPINSTLSADGRYLAFGSYADNLVAGDNNGKGDIFVYDRITHTTERVEANLTPGADSSNPLISADGHYVAFNSFASNLVSGDTNGVPDVFIFDRVTGTTERMLVDGQQPNNGSVSTSITAHGEYVGFYSAASNLVAGDTNGCEDAFVFDRDLTMIDRVSVASDGTQANGDSAGTSLSADGRHAAFSSFADNLVAGDTNGVRDVFVFDRVLRTTERVSIATDGAESNGESSGVSISADGRFVAFYSLGSSLVAGDTNNSYDVFVHDRETNATIRVSVAADGTQGNGDSFHPIISPDGQSLSFDSHASNLIANDHNGVSDVFVVSLSSYEWLLT